MRSSATPRARIAVRVTARAGRDEVEGWSDGELHVRVTAAPDAGKANAAVRVLLAGRLGVPKTAVRIVRGGSSRHKLVEADGIDDVTVRELTNDGPGGLVPDAPSVRRDGKDVT